MRREPPLVLRRLLPLTLLSAASAMACGPSGYYYEASEGRVPCETDEMTIREKKTFGTRQWQVQCQGKKYDCKGTKAAAKCIERVGR